MGFIVFQEPGPVQIGSNVWLAALCGGEQPHQPKHTDKLV